MLSYFWNIFSPASFTIEKNVSPTISSSLLNSSESPFSSNLYSATPESYVSNNTSSEIFCLSSPSPSSLNFYNDPTYEASSYNTNNRSGYKTPTQSSRLHRICSEDAEISPPRISFHAWNGSPQGGRGYVSRNKTRSLQTIGIPPKLKPNSRFEI